MRRVWRHPWAVTPARARDIQLAGLLRDPPGVHERRAAFDLEGFARRGVLAAVDVGYDAPSRLCFAALVLWDVAAAAPLERLSNVAPATFPYVPGLLTFREIPPLLPLFRRLRRAPDLILCDGQGLAHPRRFGVARHMGAVYDVPSLGWAKSRLVGEHDDPPNEPGGAAPLMDHGEQIGWAFRSRAGTKPTFVSPGHRLTVDESLALARLLRGRYRLCEPARAAHALTTELLARRRAEA